jgi:hypothetical protein
MKNFIRENTDMITKFVLTHIVMSVLGIMVGLAVLSIEGEADGFSLIALISAAFTIGFMCFMHYDDMYFAAEKEGIRIRAEGGNIDVLKGLKVTLLAYSPVLLIGLVAICVDLFASDDASAISLLAYYAVQGSFLTLYKLLDYVGVVGYVLITLIPAIVSSALGYVFGVKDKTIRGMMGMDVAPPYEGPIERKPKTKGK